ncbi:MAG TPA: CusA/CzcA family heavy metal efflux RND transporter [Oligoflexus sp.]|uniref:efflux RND transporter permease subunit n=1 Tax=Oligoflexus sp. TaxID=1971216 RepID=UPI002D803D65|nr:CusA/CzcA family heavy metal efflux RND transporter [Oligoflexus sp.]HET9239225.1 CusA/CzcA family heavy metal efflux RND transporter [Oligoflexus sp.]
MLDRILKFSIQHRFLIMLMSVVVAIAGLFSLTRLPIDAVPDITNVQVQINTVSSALSPIEMEKQVTFPIETTLAGIPGLTYTRSLSRNGFSQVTAVFKDDVDIYFARQQVAERLLEARENLPPGTDPKMGPISTGLGEVFMWTLEFGHPGGKDAPLGTRDQPGWQEGSVYVTPEGQRLTDKFEQAAYLRTVQDWIIRPQLKSLEGVAGVDTIGGFVKQYHVHPDPNKLIAFGLSFTDVIEALEKNNVSTGAGYIERNGESYLVRADGRIGSLDQIASIVVGSQKGTPIRIGDIADVRLGQELRTGSASKSGQEAVVGTALMLIGENSRAVAKAVDEKIQTIRKSLPTDVIITPVLNRTKLVDATIKTVEKNLAEGAILVIVVLFLLLGNIKAALITASAIPLSMLMTSMGMVRWKISGNLMSLGAIDFGLIVDGAVIIVENCLRHLAEKQHQLKRELNLNERLHEVFVASKEVIKPSAFGQAIIITVYLPIISLTGIEGKMFHPMAMTVIIALAAAFILSITLVPALVAMFIKGKISEKENRLFAWAKNRYEPAIHFAINRSKPVVAVAVGIFLLSILLFGRLGQEFIPTLDEKDLAIQALRIPSTGITQSTKMQGVVEKTIASFPEVAFVFSKTGTAEMASDPMPPNASDTFIILKPQDDWPNKGETKEELRARLEKALGNLPGNNYEFTQPIQMRFNELIAGVRGDVAVKVYGEEFADIEATAAAIGRIIQSIPGAADVKVEQTKGLPVMNVEIDRNLIARNGLSMKDVQDVVNIAIGGREAGMVFEGDRRFDLMVRLPESIRDNIDELKSIPVPLPQDKDDERSSASSPGMGHRHEVDDDDRPSFIPLGELANLKTSEGPNQISRENGKRRIVVQANVRDRDIGSFVAEAQEKIDKEVKLRSGQWLEWGGQFENLVAARQRLAIVVPACFLLIFIILFSAYGSAKYALIIFSGVPLALSGGVIALWLRGMPFSITAAVGFIALSGVAVLNGLVMVSFINQLREEGLSLEDAILKGSLTRLRPVLMTALVASLGFLPMALATGTGAEVQKPLATVVVGGLFTSTLLTLLVLPALYKLFERRKVEEADI